MPRKCPKSTKYWQRLWCLSFLVLLVPLSGQVFGAVTTQKANEQFASLAYALRNDQITRLEVFWIPRDVETFSDISSEALRRRYQFKFEIRCTQSSYRLSQLLQAVSETQTSDPLRGDRDFRWGLVAYSKAANVRWEIDLGRWCKNAEINGFGVSVNDKLNNWLAKNTQNLASQKL